MTSLDDRELTDRIGSTLAYVASQTPEPAEPSFESLLEAPLVEPREPGRRSDDRRSTRHPRGRPSAVVVIALAAVLVAGVVVALNRDDAESVAIKSADTSASTETSVAPLGSGSIGCGHSVPASAAAAQLTATLASPFDHPSITVRNDGSAAVQIASSPTSLLLIDGGDDIVSNFGTNDMLVQGSIDPGESKSLTALPAQTVSCVKSPDGKLQQLPLGHYRAVGVLTVDGRFYSSEAVSVTLESNGTLR